MKRAILSLLTLATLVAARAELNGNGYYRVNNYKTGRYVYVCDNKGTINASSTSIDAGAIQLWSGFERTIYDPATVVYFEQHDGKYDITAQHTGIYQMIGQYVSIRADQRIPGTYWAYGSKSGMTKYLADNQNDLSFPDGYFDEGNGEYRNWYITPVSSSSDNYFGVLPTASAAGKHYAAFFADFPFSFASQGMRALYVTKVDKNKGVAVYREISGPVAPSVPVIIECSADKPAANRLDIGTAGSQAVNGNLLRGVYFNSTAYKHVNQTPYDRTRMRSLGVTSTGKIGLVEAAYDFVPANTFYLPVDADTPAELVLMSETEYESGIADITADSPAGPFDIYTLQGVCVRRAATSLEGLTPGVYIAGGRKVLIDSDK